MNNSEGIIQKKKLRLTIGIIVGVLIVVTIVVFALSRMSVSSNLPKDGYFVETPYCTLYYPNSWGDNIKTEAGLQSEGIYTVTYLCRVEAETARLFTVSFGETEAEILGYIITESSEKIPVSIEFFTLEETLNWTESNSALAHSMRDASEQLINVLVNDSKFSLNQ